MNIIYKFTNRITGLSYIGKTSYTFAVRKRNHIRSSKEPVYDFHKAVNQYGIEVFDEEILEDNIENDHVNDREIFYIEKYDSFLNGYNMTKGGGLTNHSEDTKIKMRKPKSESHKESMRKPKSESHKESMRKAQKGRIISEKHAEKISKALQGNVLSDETKNKISESLKGRTYSKETIQKYSENAKGAGNNAAKKIHIYDSKGVLMYKTHGNFISFCEENKLPTNSLKSSYLNDGKPIFQNERILKRAVNQKYKGFRFWYAKIED